MWCCIFFNLSHVCKMGNGHSKGVNEMFNEKYRAATYQRNDDILDSVKDVVDIIANKMGKAEPKLKIQEVILVGSAAENTQVGEVSDYDFQFVLDDLSESGTIDVLNECDDNGYVHVVVQQEDKKHTWAKLLHNGYLKSTKGKHPDTKIKGVRQLFHKSLQTVLTQVPDLHTSAGILQNNKQTEKHGPAFTVYFGWFQRMYIFFWLGKQIKIDLCPVIRFRGNLRFINRETVTCDAYYDYQQRVGSVMLMPLARRASCTYGKCFKTTFTEVEVLLMRDMSEHHRKCCIILKYLLNGCEERPATAMNSYVLKTLVLNHHYKEKCEETSNYALCLDKLLEQIRTILKDAKKAGVGLKMFLPSPFLKRHNVWNNEQSVLNIDLDKRLDKLIRCVAHWEDRPRYCFNVTSVNNNNYVLKSKKSFSKKCCIICLIFLLLCLIIIAYGFGHYMGHRRTLQYLYPMGLINVTGLNEINGQ